jgi:hypothetical protein
VRATASNLGPCCSWSIVSRSRTRADRKRVPRHQHPPSKPLNRRRPRRSPTDKHRKQLLHNRSLLLRPHHEKPSQIQPCHRLPYRRRAQNHAPHRRQGRTWNAVHHPRARHPRARPRRADPRRAGPRRPGSRPGNKTHTRLFRRPGPPAGHRMRAPGWSVSTRTARQWPPRSILRWSIFRSRSPL